MARTKQTARKSTGGKARTLPANPTRPSEDTPSDRPNNEANLIHAEKVARRSPVHLIPFDATRVWWQFIRVTEVDDSLRDRRGVLVTPTLLLDPNSVEKDDRWEMVDKVRLDGDADVLFTRDLAYIDETGLTGTWCVDPVISEANGDVLRISEQFFF